MNNVAQTSKSESGLSGHRREDMGGWEKVRPPECLWDDMFQAEH